MLWGDGVVTAGREASATLIGGADLFIFGATDGLDRIEDFRGADGDQVSVSGAGLIWGQLDSNGSGELDDADAFVAVNGSGTLIDLGLASGASEPGLNVVTVAGVVGLVEADFLLS